MVTGARRDTHEAQIVATRDVRDQRLRPVTPGHAQHVGALTDRPLGQLDKIVALTEHDRPHTAPLRLGDQTEPRHLPAARPRVHQQHTPLRRRHPRRSAQRIGGQIVTQRVPRRRPRQRQQHHHQHQLDQRHRPQQRNDQPDQGQDRDDRRHDPGSAAMHQRSPTRRHGNQQRHDRDHQPAQITPQRDHHHHQRRYRGQQRPTRRPPAARRRPRPGRVDRPGVGTYLLMWLHPFQPFSVATRFKPPACLVIPSF